MFTMRELVSRLQQMPRSTDVVKVMIDDDVLHVRDVVLDPEKHEICLVLNEDEE